MPAHRKTGPAEWLELICARAKELRDAGVVQLQLEGCTVTLQPPDAPVVIQQQAQERDTDLDPLLDAATYGRRDGSVPGYPRRRPEES